MVKDILISFLFQTVFTIGVIVLFGFLIGLCNKIFYANFGNYGRAVCYVTGAFGTPLHECSHALFCLIFGHKIDEIKLFQINSSDGTLGYVNHSYNKRNLYQRIGNFFIGIAPIIVISAVLFLFAYLLLPDMLSKISADMQITDIVNNVSAFFVNILDVLKTFFSYASTWRWWVFIIIGAVFALHMTLSKADIKGALSGLFFLLAVMLIIDIVLRVISENLLFSFTQVILSFANYLLCFLLLSLIISVIALIVSFVFRLIKRGV